MSIRVVNEEMYW